MYDANGNYDVLGAKIKNTMSFRYNQGYLASQALEGNPIYMKLKKRVIQFHIINEKYRINGASKQQLDEEVKTGVKF